MKNDVQKYVDKYDDVRGQVDRITNELEQHKTRLLTDIVRLDKLYDANLEYFRMLEVYIAAGRAKGGGRDHDPAAGSQGRGRGRRDRRPEAARPSPRATTWSGASTTSC